MKNPYDVIGVPRNATQKEIKTAYRKLAKELHPDLHPNDDEVLERFKEISAAYDILTDPEKLARFESGLMDATMGPGGNPTGGPSRGPVNWDENFGPGNTPADLFGDIAGNRRGRGGTSMWLKGEDMFHAVEVPFIDACCGSELDLVLPTTAKVAVTIPPGTSNGDILHIPGQGFPGMGGGPPGNLNLQITVRPHAVFVREGNDIHLELPISAEEAAQGGPRPVGTISGETKIDIPAGCEDGQMVRIPGAGVIDRKTDQRGDQLITLRIRRAENDTEDDVGDDVGDDVEDAARDDAAPARDPHRAGAAE